MAGWCITGVRGEGKTLCAVSKIKQYLERGRSVATNLDLYLDKLLDDEDNDTLVYRLPDKPRIEDFDLLPPAYDVDYKAEDMNGLLVLDELGTWLNSRTWNDKTRLPVLNWLFLSRKLHWDLIILAQDYEMIDAQVRNTLCDYWVQSSRLDRQKIPYLAPVLDFIGINSFMPKIHKYFVFYGFSSQQKPADTWTFRGLDVYDGYNTNQRFLDGLEVLNNQLVDMRATYTYLPVSYLTKRVYVQRLEQQIEAIQNLGVTEMAAKKNIDTSKVKIYILLVFLVLFVGWRVLKYSGDPMLSKSIASPVVSLSPTLPVVPTVAPAPVSPLPTSPLATPAVITADTSNFIDELLKVSRPRLSALLQSSTTGEYMGIVDFVQDNVVVERFRISELHGLGVVIVRASNGVQLLYKGKAYFVSSVSVSLHRK